MSNTGLFVIVNPFHPMGPTALQENDVVIYRDLQEAIKDALFAAVEYKNPDLEIHQLVHRGDVNIRKLISTHWVCFDCWEMHPMGGPCPKQTGEQNE